MVIRFVLYLLGLGFGIFIFVIVVVIGYIFIRRCFLVLGVCMVGVGVGMIVFFLVYILLFEMYGFCGFFLIIVGFFLNNVVLGIFFRFS